MKVRRPAVKSPGYSKARRQLQLRQHYYQGIAPQQSAIDRHLALGQGPISRIAVTIETMKAMEVEVMDLGVMTKPVSASALASALVGSRRVISRHANAEKLNTLARVTRRLQNLAFRKNRTEDDSLKRRYEIVNALNRIERLPDSTTKMISSWEEAKEALEAVINFPQLDSLIEGKDEEKDVSGILKDEIASTFDMQLNNLFRLEEADNLVPLTDKWKQVAVYPVPSKLGETSSTDVAHRTALDKADRMFKLRLDSAISDFDSLRTSDAVKDLEDRFMKAEQEAEARKRASSLMRPLSEEEQERVRNAMFGIGPAQEQLAQSGSDYVQRASMQTLRPGQWLNDEIIHYFLLMLSKRDEELRQKDSARKPCHFFKSFFITKLLNEGHSNPDMDGKYEYRNVKRWSKKVPGKDLFKLDKIFFPINQSRMHWLCACAFINEKRIEVYDSLGSSGTKYLSSIFQYLQDDHKDKKGTPLPDIDQWKLVASRDETPQQLNGKLNSRD